MVTALCREHDILKPSCDNYLTMRSSWEHVLPAYTKLGLVVSRLVSPEQAYITSTTVSQQTGPGGRWSQSRQVLVSNWITAD